MSAIHGISIDAIRVNLMHKTGGAPYTNEMILEWIEKNKRAMHYEYVGEDMMLTVNQAIRVTVGVHQNIDYFGVSKYLKGGYYGRT